MGKDLQNMFSNAKGMLPSVPKMPNMCDVDVSGSASKALSGLTSYLSGIYQDLFEPYNEELAVRRPPEELGNLDKEEETNSNIWVNSLWIWKSDNLSNKLLICITISKTTFSIQKWNWRIF